MPHEHIDIKRRACLFKILKSGNLLQVDNQFFPYLAHIDLQPFGCNIIGYPI